MGKGTAVMDFTRIVIDRAARAQIRRAVASGVLLGAIYVVIAACFVAIVWNLFKTLLLG